MAQSVAKLLSAPTASSKLHTSTTTSKTIDPVGTSFRETLKQVKKKPGPERQATAKEPAATKAESKKPVAAAKPADTAANAKPAPDKTHKSQPTTGASKKSHVSDHAEEGSQGKGDSSDPSASQDQPDGRPKAQSEKVNSTAADTSAAALSAVQMAAAAQLAVPASKTATPAEVQSTKSSADPKTKTDPSQNAAVVPADNTSRDSGVAAGTLTAQAIQGSDTPQTTAGNDGSASGQSDNPATPQAVDTPQAAARGKAKGVQISKSSDSGADQSGTDPAAAQLAPLVSANANTSTDEGDNAQKSAGAAIKAVDDILSKIGMAESMGDAHAPKPLEQAKGAAGSPAVATRPEARFAELNHPTIVSGIQGKLLPDGGAMDIHLSPPNLGAMHVRVEVRDGAVTASFQAEDVQTAKLLSHSLGDLKTALEAQGINVEKLHVSQMPKDHQPTQDGNKNNAQREADRGQQHAAQQEQQRKDMMRRMWRRLMKGQDPLDLVA
ncbi:MAG TPA: flagellar hook-length control protein FliK [Tepidisphaeraceae bacterium]|jgi:flagellar hook-length control protein FliK